MAYRTNWPVKLDGQLIDSGKPIEPGKAAKSLLDAGAIVEVTGPKRTASGAGGEKPPKKGDE